MTSPRFYSEFAGWWPLVSPVADYQEEAAWFAALLASRGPVKTVLELGAGGGHNAHYLKARYDLTLTDLSPAMLDLSRSLNPRCAHVVGDMRTLRLDRTFDAVFVHDAIDYMTTEADLAAAFRTAAAHLAPGGLAVFAPDDVKGTFAESTHHDGSSDDTGRGVRFLEWTWDPDPTDTAVRTEYVFVFRTAAGDVQTVHDAHVTGLFDEQTWHRLLGEAGFAPHTEIEATDDDRAPRRVFVGVKRG